MKQCAYCQNGKCMVMNNIEVKNPNECHCVYYKNEIITCAKCNRVIVDSPIASFTDGSWKFYCENCVRI